MKKLIVLLSALMAVSAFAFEVMVPANDAAADHAAIKTFLKGQGATLESLQAQSYDSNTGVIGYFITESRSDDEGSPITTCATISVTNEVAGHKVFAQINEGSYKALASCTHSL